MAVLLCYMLSLPFTAFTKLFFNVHMLRELIGILGLLAEAFIIIYIGIHILCQKKMNFQVHIVDYLLLAMLVWSIPASLLAENRDKAIYGSLYMNDGLLTYFTYAAVYLCGKLIDDKQSKLKLVKVFAYSISAVCVLSVVQVISKTSDIFGVFAENVAGKCIYISKYAGVYPNINHFAYMLAMSVLALAGLAIYEENRWKKVVYWGLYGFNIWALSVNNTVGSYLAVIIGLGFTTLLLFLRKEKKGKEIACMVAILIIASAMGSVMTQNRLASSLGTTADDLVHLNKNEDAGSGRIKIWKQTIEYIVEKPVFGHGPENLGERYKNDGIFLVTRPHNEYLQHTVFLGIPASCMYLGALIKLLIECLNKIKRVPPIVVILGGLVCAYCVSAFFGNTMYSTSVYFFMMLGMLSTYSKCIEE